MSGAQDKAQTAIRETAAEWIVRLGAVDADASDKSAFAEWLRQSPLHVKEYLRAEAAWEAVGTAAVRDTSDIEALLRPKETNVVALSSSPSANIAQTRVNTRTSAKKVRVSPWLAFVAAVALVVAIGFMLAPRFIDRLDPNLYTTGVGEQRRVVLADGSAVELNTHSRIRIDMDGGSRHVHLLQGEAFFDVARDPHRPFRVFSDAVVVRAIGTQFNVYRHAEGHPEGTVVAVLEGRVAVWRDLGNKASAPVELVASQQAQIRARQSAISKGDADLRKTTAWRQRRLIFDNESLASVIAEFNRYNAQQLVIEDRGLIVERITGSFDADKPLALIRFLEAGGDARVLESSALRIVLGVPAGADADPAQR